MKTLDEVIKALEYCLNPVDNFGNCNAECPYIHCCDPSNHDVTEDALHYLKELRDMTDIPMEYFENGGTSQKVRNTSQITCPKCHSEFVILPEANNALTWDELKSMEGKPVWVEYIKGDKRVDAEWIIIKKVKETCIENTSGRFQADSRGWSWQAYRKERTDDSGRSDC